jgi:hypothetical protein
MSASKNKNVEPSLCIGCTLRKNSIVCSQCRANDRASITYAIERKTKRQKRREENACRKKYYA